MELDEHTEILVIWTQKPPPSLVYKIEARRVMFGVSEATVPSGLALAKLVASRICLCVVILPLKLDTPPPQIVLKFTLGIGSQGLPLLL